MDWNDPPFLKTIKQKQTNHNKKPIPYASKYQELSKVLDIPVPPSSPFSTLFSFNQDKLMSFLILYPTLLLVPPFFESKPLGQPYLPFTETRGSEYKLHVETRRAQRKVLVVFFRFSTLLKAYGLVEILSFLEMTRGSTDGIATSK